MPALSPAPSTISIVPSTIYGSGSSEHYESSQEFDQPSLEGTAAPEEKDRQEPPATRRRMTVGETDDELQKAEETPPADRTMTPGVGDVFQVLSGAKEACLGPDALFCDLCGRAGLGIICQERCMGCADNHCRRCLWVPPGAAVGTHGLCAHCVFDLVELGLGGLDVQREEDEYVFAAAQDDEAFMLYAKRLGDVWDEAEELHQVFVMCDAHHIHTPRG